MTAPSGTMSRAACFACGLVLSLALAAPPLGAQTAEAGDPAVRLELARRYHEGRGVVQNFTRAAEIFAPLAEAGNAEAQNALGRYHHEGLGVPKDRAAALDWLGLAARSGVPQYLFDHAVVLEQDGTPEELAQAAALYARAAEAGLEEAAISLGLLYQEGRGVAQDYARARALYEGPAAAGSARAQNNLGLLYVRGSGVPQDYARAAELFNAAAAQGMRRAMYNLGVLYENGFGVATDEAKAHELYRMAGNGETGAGPGFVYDARLAPPPADEAGLARLQQAARAGDPVAAFQLGWLLVQGDPVTPQALASARQLFSLSAARGYPPAMANLAQLYVLGRGVPQDYVEALVWLLLAGTAAFPEATAMSAALQAQMTPGQIAEAQQLAEARWQAGRP
ncbi:hypothetical protein ATO6_23700 [Oceanicola sp. 22II-s10i]|uniref:SEL1-like repeat protein n=1 Tax=Oceanicola sp. 22II-s10i TaxID=1317116 RepID=UPI000B651AD6|nr:tetratricopeptide repeat protein [Oceanicola sp. 22II-s10i]OWU81689.1 hypothetical protein ATO6_23700 [Oceanicola sp. 22II-s10i]